MRRLRRERLGRPQDIEVRETHRVHAKAASAIIRARKPEAGGCCEPAQGSSPAFALLS